MRVILIYKNFAANRHISHIGLGVSAINTCKTLQRAGIQCDVWPVVDGNQLRQMLRMNQGDPVTHVVISAPWIPTHGLSQLCTLFPRIHFVMNCHSNVGFLQADTNGMRLIREALELEMGQPNFSVAANSERLKHWLEDGYGHPCKFLPNLYFLNGMQNHMRPGWRCGKLRIGAFGAIRPQKNLASSAGAAIELSFQLKTDTEFFISSGRSEGGGDTILRTVREMLKGLPHIRLVEAGWLTWPAFRHLIGSMDILFQPSYTESFNMVTADGIAEGVPSVISDAITWAPPHWRARADDVFDIARVGRQLLHDHQAARHGYHSLEAYIREGLQHWRTFLHRQ